MRSSRPIPYALNSTSSQVLSDSTSPQLISASFILQGNKGVVNSTIIFYDENNNPVGSPITISSPTMLEVRFMRISKISFSDTNPYTIAALVQTHNFYTIDDLHNFASINTGYSLTQIPTNLSVSVSNTVTVSGSLAVTQSGTWNIATLTSITDTVTVTGSVSISNTSIPITIASNAGTLTVDVSNASIAVTATQTGSWSVNVSNTSLAVTQSGTWDIATLTSITDTVTVTGSVSISNTSIPITIASNAGTLDVSVQNTSIAVAQSGTWNINQITSIQNNVPITVEVDNVGLSKTNDYGVQTQLLNDLTSLTGLGTLNLTGTLSISSDSTVPTGAPLKNSITSTTNNEIGFYYSPPNALDLSSVQTLSIYFFTNNATDIQYLQIRLGQGGTSSQYGSNQITTFNTGIWNKLDFDISGISSSVKMNVTSIMFVAHLTTTGQSYNFYWALLKALGGVPQQLDNSGNVNVTVQAINTSVAVTATQTGSWSVNVSNTSLAVTQSGTWNIATLTSITDTVSVSGSVSISNTSIPITIASNAGTLDVSVQNTSIAVTGSVTVASGSVAVTNTNTNPIGISLDVSNVTGNIPIVVESISASAGNISIINASGNNLDINVNENAVGLSMTSDYGIQQQSVFSTTTSTNWQAYGNAAGGTITLDTTDYTDDFGGSIDAVYSSNTNISMGPEYNIPNNSTIDISQVQNIECSMKFSTVTNLTNLILILRNAITGQEYVITLAAPSDTNWHKYRFSLSGVGTFDEMSLMNSFYFTGTFSAAPASVTVKICNVIFLGNIPQQINTDNGLGISQNSALYFQPNTITGTYLAQAQFDTYPATSYIKVSISVPEGQSIKINKIRIFDTAGSTVFNQLGTWNLSDDVGQMNAIWYALQRTYLSLGNDVSFGIFLDTIKTIVTNVSGSTVSNTMLGANTSVHCHFVELPIGRVINGGLNGVTAYYEIAGTGQGQTLTVSTSIELDFEGGDISYFSNTVSGEISGSPSSSGAGGGNIVYERGIIGGNIIG